MQDQHLDEGRRVLPIALLRLLLPPGLTPSYVHGEPLRQWFSIGVIQPPTQGHSAMSRVSFDSQDWRGGGAPSI